MKAVTYGPFPGGWPTSFEPDFLRITVAGFNAIRIFDEPELPLLNAAHAHGLKVFGGLQWGQHIDFIARPAVLTAAKIRLVNSLKALGGHPALAGIYVANEIPADLVRWMGPAKVREAIESLIAVGKEICPSLLFAYANYPSTEYLEPGNADFTAFNVYLEEESALRSYLKRLHHIAGDRPLVISEFGLDSLRNGRLTQAHVLCWGILAAHDHETAGITIYAWSDRWWNNGAEVTDWNFGLIDREGVFKTALDAVSKYRPPVLDFEVAVSIIVCTRNGHDRIANCLRAIGKIKDKTIETIVVDDGSNDGTGDLIEAKFPWVRLLRLEPSGLSNARNAGAEIATGELLAFTDDDCEPDEEWIVRIRRIFADHRYAAACGPNLPPRPRNWQEAVVNAAPGAPSHVMLNDDDAEHLPGCNLVVSKSAFHSIGGFDPQFATAGDDVDFCWRLRDMGFHLGFVPGAFVWHHRRPSIIAFLRQQLGYGRAEKLLLKKHPHRFSKSGDAKWQGFVYGGGPVRVTDDSIIYHGTMGCAGYQSIVNRMLPLRDLDARFSRWKSRWALKAVKFLQPRLRAWARNRKIFYKIDHHEAHSLEPHLDFQIASDGQADRLQILEQLMQNGWTAGDETSEWDAKNEGTKLLFATEHNHDGSKTILVRVWGDKDLLPFEVQNPPF